MMFRTRCLTLLALCLALLDQPAGAQPPQDDEAIESAGDALRGYPWYDGAADGVQRIDVEPPSDLKNRHSRWLATPWNWRFPDWLLTLLKVLVWIVFILLVSLLVYLMVRSFMSFEAGFAERSRSSSLAPLGGDVDRVEELPFQLKRPRGDLLSEARRHYEAGRYGEAMIYLYSYQLLQLDKSQVIRLTRGKTNRQYLREVRRRPSLFELMQSSMVLFEDVFFGDHVLSRQRFESCWNRLDEFHQHLEMEHAVG